VRKNEEVKLIKPHDLIKECLEGQIEKEKKITGTKIKNHVHDPFITYCDRFASPEEKDTESAFLGVLAQRGVDHEAKIKNEIFPNLSPLTLKDPIEAFQYAIKSMFEGHDGFTNFPFFYISLGLEGHIDILRKNNSHNSVFGKYYYEVCEVKIAKHLKVHHILQAAFYNYLIGLIQKFTPPRFFMINGEGNESVYTFKDYNELLMTVMDQIKQVWNKEYEPEPFYGSDCFPWTNLCNKTALEKKDLSIIPGIGAKKRESLNNAGFNTLEDIVPTNISELTKIKGFGKKIAKEIKLHAQAVLEERIIQLKVVDLERHFKEIFVDLEGFDPTTVPKEIEPIDFLFGVLVNEKEKKIFHDFTIYDPFDNTHCSEVFLKFIDLLSSIKEVPIYHWGSYDKSRVLKQAKTYGILDSRINPIIERFIDLSRIVKQLFVFPIPSRSLKILAPYLGFKWRTSQMTGRDAVVKYLKYLKDEYKDKSIVQEVINYNEDDLLALKHILDWIMEHKNHQIP